MGKYKLIAAAIVGVCAVMATAASASAQTVPFNASYNLRYVGHNGTPACPAGVEQCGTGTADTYGAFTAQVLMNPANPTQLQFLIFTFPNGTLVLDETLVSIDTPGNSFSANASPNSFGFPTTYRSTWSVDSLSTGIFQGATGNGTDVEKVAGIQDKGATTGTLTLGS